MASIYFLAGLATMLLFVVAVQADPSPLYGLMSSWAGDFNITVIDPKTGNQLSLLYASKTELMMFDVTPSIDHSGQRLFIPLIGYKDQSVNLAVFDMSNAGSGKVILTTMIPILGSYFFGLQYDAATDTVFIISTYAHKRSEDRAPPPTGCFIQAVNLKAGSATNVSVIPSNLIPAVLGLGGGPSSFDPASRTLLIPLKNIVAPVTFYFGKFNVDSNHWDINPLNSVYPMAMAVNEKTHTTFGLLSPVTSGPPGLLNFGTIDPVSGSMNIISKWTSPNMVWAVGALSAFDSSNGLFYSLIGNGLGVPVHLVTVDSSTGQITQQADYYKNQPQGFFCL